MSLAGDDAAEGLADASRARGGLTPVSSRWWRCGAMNMQEELDRLRQRTFPSFHQLQHGMEEAM
jgi:hypothetical protein